MNVKTIAVAVVLVAAAVDVQANDGDVARLLKMLKHVAGVVAGG